MKMKLLIDLPINKKHGAKKGAIFEVVRDTMDAEDKLKLYFFIGLDGSECGAFPREVEIINEEK